MSDKKTVYYGIYQHHTEGRKRTGLANGPFGMIKDDQAAAMAAAWSMFGRQGFVKEGDNPDHMQVYGPGKIRGTRTNPEEPFDSVQITNVYGNPERATSWALYFGEHPHSRQDNNVYAVAPPYDEGDDEPEVIGFSGHRSLTEINLREFNYVKRSGLSGNEIRKGGTCTIKVDGVQLTEFNFRDMDWGLNEARRIKDKIKSCPFNLSDSEEREKLVGRKVYYREHPAVVESMILDQGCVILRADPAPFPLTPYEIEENSPFSCPSEPNDTAKVEIWSDLIWWWRDKKEIMKARSRKTKAAYDKARRAKKTKKR